MMRRCGVRGARMRSRRARPMLESPSILSIRRAASPLPRCRSRSIPRSARRCAISTVRCSCWRAPAAARRASSPPRSAHLIERGHDPKRIAAITFTNKAAREMRERVGGAAARSRASGDLAADVAISHVPCARPADHPRRRRGAGPEARLLDPRSRRHRADRRRADRDDRPRARARRAVADQRAGRTRWSSPAAAAKAAQSDDEAAAAQAYRRYDDTLRAYQAVDFDDLIALPIALLATRRGGGGEVARALRAPAGRRVPGHQSGAVPAAPAAGRASARRSPSSATTTRRSTAGAARRSTTSRELPKDYPALKVIKLEQNYRSTVRILRSANALIANNPKLFDKKLWSEHGHGDRSA